MGVHRKIWFLEGEVHKKPIYRGKLLKKGGGGGGRGQFVDLRGDLLKEGGRALREGVDTQCTLCAFRTSAK